MAKRIEVDEQSVGNIRSVDDLLAYISGDDLNRDALKKAGRTDYVNKSLPSRITAGLEQNAALNRSISDWRVILTKECQVYVIGEQYIAKRFDQVHYKYTGLDEAKEILIDNLYAILLYKYFPNVTDAALERIDKIVKGLTSNIKSFLTKIVLDSDDRVSSGMKMKRVPNSAVAFANGIFDFIKNEFICDYQKIFIPSINNTIILYNDYIIEWNFDFDFTPLPIKITETTFDEFVDMLRALDEESQNYCWELFYNMTHTEAHEPDVHRMRHLSEILGYTLIPQFLQYFIMLIGSGQNGKNSLFDGCFSSHVIPRPVSNSIESIEKDRFITGSLENACHNIFLETSPKTYTDSNMLKALTGSMYQTIESKGVAKYSGVINCKYIFAGNDQSKIKFSDATVGFRRRINLFEIFYSWDANHRFMKYGDYYQTDFSGDLHEIKEDLTNTIVYIYLGMYGILSATKNFTRDFKFTQNEWNDSYTDIDHKLKDFFNNSLKVEDYFKYLDDYSLLEPEKLKAALYTTKGCDRLYLTPEMKRLGIFNFEDLVKFMNGTREVNAVDEDGNSTTVIEKNCEWYMREHDIYVALYYISAVIQKMGCYVESTREFKEQFRKIYPYAVQKSCWNKEPYVRVRFANGKMRFIE